VDGYTTIKAKAFRSGLEPSATATETYFCEPAQCWIEMITAESDWQTSGFWHLEDYYGAGWDMVYWFRDPATGTYENPPGRAFGALSLPEIDVSGWDGSILEFYHWREVEAYAAGYDRTYVEVRFDNGPWETVWEKDSADESGFFATEWVNLTSYMPYGASTLRIRFVFDSIDAFANHFGGWIIDDVFVCPDEYWILGVPEVEDEPTIEAVCQPSPIRDVNTATFFVKGVEADAIRVEIFDLAGTLVFSSEDMGDEIVWHTESDYGEYLANGIYLFRMTALVDGEWMACGEPEKLVILR